MGRLQQGNRSIVENGSDDDVYGQLKFKGETHEGIQDTSDV